jgi:hypothetical protein
MRSFVWLLGCIIIIMPMSCDKTNDDPPEERRVEGGLSFLDVIDARALILGGNTGGLKSAGQVTESADNSLFKITEEGVVQEITYWMIDTIYTQTEEGEQMRIDSVEVTNTLFPAYLFNADENHLIVCFDMETDEDQNGYIELDYLVRKTDGAVFQLPYGLRPLTATYHHNPMFRNEDITVLVQKDEAGHIYYIGKGDLQKISTLDPQNVTVQQLTTGGESGEGVSNFRVNGSGNILFISGGATTGNVTKIRFSNGGLAYPEKSVTPFWLGFDNNFYFSYTPPYDAGSPSMPVVERITMANQQVSYEYVGEVNHPEANLTTMNGSYFFRLDALNKIVVMDFGDAMNQIGNVVAEVYNTDMEVKAFPMADLGITKINLTACSGNYYYLAGLNGNQPVLLKVDPSVFPHQPQQLVPQGSYDVYKMAVTSDNYVLMHALRMSDGNTVISQISPSGEITQLEDIGSEIIQLVQVR